MPNTIELTEKLAMLIRARARIIDNADRIADPIASVERLNAAIEEARAELKAHNQTEV